ncbi:MAG: hypothetical protein ACI8WY_003293 [Planctomycetota bacterium]
MLPASPLEESPIGCDHTLARSVGPVVMQRDSADAAVARAAEASASPGGGLLAWAFVGALLVGTFSHAGLARAAWAWIHRGPVGVEVWAVDRAAHAVFGLDHDGIVVERRLAPGERGTGQERSLSAAASVLPPSWRIEAWPGLLGDRLVAHAADDPGWGRARPGVWALVRSKTEPEPRSSPGGGVGGQFLERWVRTGTPWRWQRAFRFRLPWRSRALASQESGVWVAAERQCTVQHRAHTGVLRFERDLLDGDGVDALCGASTRAGGGVWIAAGGALLRLDRTGSRRPGQGGFAHLTRLVEGSRAAGEPFKPGAKCVSRVAESE